MAGHAHLLARRCKFEPCSVHPRVEFPLIQNSWFFDRLGNDPSAIEPLPSILDLFLEAEFGVLPFASFCLRGVSGLPAGPSNGRVGFRLICISKSNLWAGERDE